MLERYIPSTNEKLPVIGLGTWQTFDVGADADTTKLTQVLQTMRANGATLIDTSPMYGKSEEVIGRLTEQLPSREEFFYATKVWTEGREAGIIQMEDSLRKMKRSAVDLIQIHNLVDWRTHYKTLQTWKAEGKVRYIGITHYTDDMHIALEDVMNEVEIDFVQFNYSIVNRHAEKRLLQVAADKGVATLINRPFGTGKLFHQVKGKALPEWTKEYDIETWGQFFLKYIVSHPAVTCAIPATSDPEHALDNMKGGIGKMPDEAARSKMVQLIESL